MIRFKTEKIGNRLSNWNSETESITRVKIESNSAQKHGGNIRIKLFYLFIFLAMTCSSAITVNNAINNYLKYEVVSQTRIISDQPSLFPKITICSTVTFPTKKASDLDNTRLECIRKQLNISSNETKHVQFLVVCPASIIDNWIKEFNTWGYFSIW